MQPPRHAPRANKNSASNLMRGILHHPSFQAIEAAWRALLMLVRDLDETGLELYLIDLTLPELDRTHGSAAAES